ncbi:unnamed protein product [Danaus chrysippus]|uniref:(African queen) hypothetical protein n=1 Tax=Danaus chrysippus TaxID=151541 RepID=A0A8J2QJR5_9NEOP|nr:unnamed protein product [Danaus chrysippus]
MPRPTYLRSAIDVHIKWKQIQGVGEGTGTCTAISCWRGQRTARPGRLTSPRKKGGRVIALATGDRQRGCSEPTSSRRGPQLVMDDSERPSITKGLIYRIVDNLGGDDRGTLPSEPRLMRPIHRGDYVFLDSDKYLHSIGNDRGGTDHLALRGMNIVCFVMYGPWR